MSTMNRFLPAAPVLLGGLLLSSCFTPDPYGPYGGGPPPPNYGPYETPQGNPPPQQGDPYGNPPPSNDPYGNPPPQDPQQGADVDSQKYPDPAPPPSKPNPADYPVAKKTKKPNEVISPYPPNNVIDVTGFKSGQMAKDPSNKKIFVVP